MTMRFEQAVKRLLQTTSVRSSCRSYPPSSSSSSSSLLSSSFSVANLRNYSSCQPQTSSDGLQSLFKKSSAVTKRRQTVTQTSSYFRTMSSSTQSHSQAAAASSSIDFVKEESHANALTGSNPIHVSDGRRAYSSSAASSASSSSSSHSSSANAWRKFPDGSRFHKHSGNGRSQRPIFVAATRQHVGKTTVSLALMSGLQKRFGRVGFVKPVGQQHVTVQSDDAKELRVDKDVCLVKEHFHLNHVDYQDMSPVIIPAGYTKRYVDGEITFDEQLQSVVTAMENVSAASDVVLCEGTGHCAVGSIVGLNNAKVASVIGADMVLVANGGLGSAFDELELNRILCQHYNVRIAGVIINKVIPEKYEQTKHYISKAMRQAWGVPLLGCIPDRPFLGCPALADLETLFKTQLICGQEHRMRHYYTQDINVVTTSLKRFLENLRQKASRTLYICHVTRDDLIVGFLGEYQRRAENLEEGPLEAALLVCGRKDKYQLSKEVEDMIRAAKGVPVMMIDLPTHTVMAKIHAFTPKLNIHDTNRVAVAVDHYEPYIDFDELERRTQASNSSFNDPSSISLEDLRYL